VDDEAVISGIKTFEEAFEIANSWNLQEYEGIDDTEGHL